MLTPDGVPGISLTNMMNSKGARTEPCGSPSMEHNLLSYVFPFSVILMLLFDRKLLIRSMRKFPDTPLLFNLTTRPSTHTESKALEKSIKRITAFSLLRFASLSLERSL